MIPREHDDIDLLEARRTAPLPMRQPRHELFEPPQTLRRFCQFGLSASDCFGRRAVASGQSEANRPQVGKGCKRCHRDNEDRTIVLNKRVALSSNSTEFEPSGNW